MGLQKSTIVMAVLTCVPFGLAARDLVTDKDTAGYRGDKDEDYDSDEIDSEELERYAKEQEAANAAERAREERRAEERKAKLASALDMLFGREPASLGPVYGAVKLDMTDVELDKLEHAAQAVRAAAELADIDVTFHAEDSILESITLESTADGEELCEVLGDKLDTRWPEHAEVGRASVWTGPTQRVEVSGTWDCKAEIRRTATPAAWIAKKGSVVPFAMIGKSTSELLKSLEPKRADLGEENYIQWMAPGLGVGLGPTRIAAEIEKGKVVGITALVNVDDATFAELEKQLDAAFGPAKERDGEPVWGTKVPVRITVSNDPDGPTSHVISIGKMPSEE